MIDPNIIANLHNYITINPQLAIVGERLQLKRLVPMAVDRAIVEIISPVVDRSVTIACMTTQVGAGAGARGWGEEGFGAEQGSTGRLVVYRQLPPPARRVQAGMPVSPSAASAQAHPKLTCCLPLRLPPLRSWC